MHVRCLSAILLVALAAGPSLAADAPIKRFMQVGPQLYRGAQPDDDGFKFLRDLGIRTIISFRGDDDERELVEALGMRFVRIPVTFVPFGGDMPEDAVKQFLATVDDPASGPVFVHCRRGADRTGAFVGLYRILRQGWALVVGAVMTKTKSRVVWTMLAFGSLGLSAVAQQPQPTHPPQGKPDHMHHRFDDPERYAKSFDDPARDAWQMPNRVIDVLALQPGASVADIGAGTR